MNANYALSMLNGIFSFLIHLTPKHFFYLEINTFITMLVVSNQLKCSVEDYCVTQRLHVIYYIDFLALRDKNGHLRTMLPLRITLFSTKFFANNTLRVTLLCPYLKHALSYWPVRNPRLKNLCELRWTRYVHSITASAPPSFIYTFLDFFEDVFSKM